jgi:4-diphosphocytidyl-2-C-methyl-D-erythritol kinase
MEYRANCKINLGLRVVRRREDGFHDIETVMLPVCGLFDTVSVSAHHDGSMLEVSGAEIDCPAEKNICMRALRLVQREYGIGEACIKLHKQIPSQAGLGGGSADAAFTLRALNEEFARGLSDARLEELGARLGSDVPFFVRNIPQFCTGRGEVMSPVEVDLNGRWLVIVKPGTAVSTAEAYAGITPYEGGIPIPEILRRPIGEWRELLVNDFEKSVFARYPEIGWLKAQLYAQGALYASMSGSGSALFGIFNHKPALDLPASVFIHTERFEEQV